MSGGLKLLPRLYREGDGDCGICFEYAVHDAIKRGEPTVLEKIVDSLGPKYCKVPGSHTASILFGAEKSGAINLIETASGVLTDNSSLLSGNEAQPLRLKPYLDQLVAALHRPAARELLPSSISGLWKADLFLGNRDSDHWVGTTVKINPAHLEAAPGLRIGIIPSPHGRNDAIRLDPDRNLVICPLPYDKAFMELFYSAWGVVQQFIEADARVPGPVYLPVASHRMVAKLLEDRRDFPVLEAIEGLRRLAQPNLLSPHQQETSVIREKAGETKLDTIIAPISRNLVD
jgi:hypothetical protein